MSLIAEIILPLPVKSNFDYRIKHEDAQRAAPGMRVLVHFGKQKIYTGVIARLREAATGTPDPAKLKEVDELLDDAPSLYEAQLRLYDWMAFYYHCTPGEVLKAALPAGLKPESALRIEMTPQLAWEELPLDDREYLLLEALHIQPALTLQEVIPIWNIENPLPRLRTMAARGLIVLKQEVEERYKPKLKTFLRLSEACTSRERLAAAFDSLSRAPHQETLLLHIAAEYQQGRIVPQTEALKQLDLGPGAVKALIDKGFIVAESVQTDRLELHGYPAARHPVTLTAGQEQALGQIRESFRAHPGRPVLLHGVTGSGKTHLYIELIREALAQGRQALYLLPEITLTKQIIDRVQGELGEAVGVYHSRFTDAERVEIWQHVRTRRYQVVIGVRSAVFLPFQDLGLILVDEEHDGSFKQHEPAPRYHARDTAIYYAGQWGCPIVLGSATPSMESYHNALRGKYTLVELPKRAVAATPPEIRLIDLRAERKAGRVQGIFSQPLEQAIRDTLARKEQVILFQNRRGYAPYLLCETCGYSPSCINCDISLTYHKQHQHLRCHYCGHTDYQVNACPECGNYTLRRAGIGTERIEEEVQTRFPEYQVRRMDLDTTRTKYGYQQLISSFEQRQTDILVGTQMVSKGLDFENVTLVGVILADHLLTYPDFRAYEQAYQLLTQVAGRSGRSTKRGQVIIQTYMPDHLVLNAIERPYRHFYDSETPGRQANGYPPYTRLLRLELQHPEQAFIEAESQRLAALLRPLFGSNLLGPDYALVARVRNRYRMQILVKLRRDLPAAGWRQALQDAIAAYFEQAPLKTLRIVADVDPM
ncbi:MAG: primosomal protein N' [Bacteroidia bacterium]|nr:primosomal protein N' [Bacteroidia bacterium]